MHPISSPTERAIAESAARHGVGVDAATHLFDALVAGGGAMAQFSHPDLGGPGQWMRGGMTMVSDLSDGTLRRRVAALCDELGAIVAAVPDAGVSTPPAAEWWGMDLGRPDSTGAQNGMRYAFFAAARRLAVESDGRVTVHDTGDHAIGGFAQQQGSGATLRLTGRHGPVDLAALPVVAGPAMPAAAAAPRVPASSSIPMPAREPSSPSVLAPRPPTTASSSPWPTETSSSPSPVGRDATAPAARAGDANDLLDTVERLAALRDRGVLTDAEFTAKKAELLARL